MHEDNMNQKQAAKILRENAPKGEFPAFINPLEAKWLMGKGASGKKTKSGLRSFFLGFGSDDNDSGNDPPSSVTGHSNASGGDGTGYKFEVGGSGPLNVSGYLKERGVGVNDPSLHMGGPGHEGENAAEYNARMTGGSGNSGGSGMPPIPNVAAGAAGAFGASGGHETMTPTGPSSKTDPNDPYGIHKKIAGGAKDLIDKPYEAPTLTPEERIAATSAETLDARGGVTDIQGTGQEAYTTAAGVGEDVSGYRPDKVGGKSFLGGTPMDKYQNPHTANVIKRNTDSAMDAMEIRRNQLMAKENMASPSGQNDRAAIERGVMQAQGLKNLGDQTAALYSAGFDKAADMKKYDMDSATGAEEFNVDAGLRGADTRLRGAESLIAGTDAGRDAAVTDIDLMSRVGADIEGKDQNVIDEKMGDFYEERDWGENKLASAANIAGTIPTGSTTTTTGAPKHRKRDKFGRIITGAASGWLASGGNPWGAGAGALGGALS